MTFLSALLALFSSVTPALALDPPMDSSNGIDCMDCHYPHNADGGKLNTNETNPGLCMTCHTSTGMASTKAFSDSDQAYPGTTGSSHRFDSGPSGHVEPKATNTSTGEVESTGTFSGRIERTYTITITTAGNVGTARYSFTDTNGGSGSGTTASTVSLNDGLSLSFSNGTASPAFVLNDVFYLYVRTDIRLPSSSVTAEAPMALALGDNNKVVCSTCHNQHSQEMTNPGNLTNSPAYTGAGSGSGRKYQRIDNDTNQACRTCHSNRDVSSSSSGSHPIGVAIPSTSEFQSPASLSLIDSKVYCTTCHSPHYATSGGANAGAGDGYLLDLSIGTICLQCHALADTSTGSHFNSATGLLWPGGQYGSTFSSHSSGYRGYCVNCHWPHGWPDDSDTTQDYPKLWVEQYDNDETSAHTDPDDAEDLCFTCHDGSPATSNVKTEIERGTNGTNIYHHPVKDSEQPSGRYVECISCHNPHKATSTDRHAGVAGVDIDGNSVGYGTATDRAITQYELCFKCHGDSYSSSRSYTSNKRTDFGTSNSAYHPVVQAGRNTSTNLTNQLRGGLTTASTIKCSDCHNSSSFTSAGVVTDSSANTVGPHGSTYAPILRANYNRNYTSGTGPSSWSASNFTFCFLCHDQTKLTDRKVPADGGSASTNFYDSINGKDNLHWVHLIDRISKSKAVCMNCHFDAHGNYSASNTQWNIDGTTYTTGAALAAARKETRMINFSPDLTATGGRAKPEWYINTATRERRCYMSCHGYTMSGYQYRPPSGDETSWTY